MIRAAEGQIWLLYPDDPDNPWVVGFEEVLYQFTGKEGRRDDRTDTLAYAVLSCDHFGYGPTCEKDLPQPAAVLPGLTASERRAARRHPWE
jgi:hypothetical protein